MGNIIFASNIVNSKNTQRIVEESLLAIKSSLELSLGPYGSTTIIEEPTLGHIMTKDGFTILDAIKFNDPISMTFLKIIKEISARLVQTVGDGSTTSIIAAYYFYNSLKKFIEENKMRPQEIINKLNKNVALLEGLLREYSKPISEDLKEIHAIASVSLNNDEEVGSIISDIYKQIGTEGFINIQLGSEYKTTYKKVEGFQFRAGYLDPSLINTETEEVELEDTAILVFNAAINDSDSLKVLEYALADLMGWIINPDIAIFKSLLIIAPDYNDAAKAMFRKIGSTFRDLNKSNKLNVIRYNMNTEDKIAEVEDLVTSTGARKVLVNYNECAEIVKYYEAKDKQRRIETGKLMQELTEEENQILENYLGLDLFYGSSDKTISSYNLTTFLGNNGCPEDLKNRIGQVRNMLQTYLDEGALDLKKEHFLKKRLAVLEQALITIYVGGNSEQQRKTNKALMEDAVAACRSAINNGYVIGGNLSIPIVIENSELHDDKFLMMISDAFKEVYKNVLRNCIQDEEIINKHLEQSIKGQCIFDLVREQYTTTDIINSVETEIEILKNVTSIISLILTSNQFLTKTIGPFSSKDIEIL